MGEGGFPKGNLGHYKEEETDAGQTTQQISISMVYQGGDASFEL